MIPLPWVASTLGSILTGMANRTPETRQAMTRVKLLGVAGFRVGQADRFGLWTVSPEGLAGDWRALAKRYE
jgi:hypothetical protein